MTVWYNEDGLAVAFGNDAGQSLKGAIGSPLSRGEDLTLIVDVDYRDLPTNAAGATTIDKLFTNPLSADVLITEAYMDVTEAFDSAGNAATLSIGLAEEDGTAIDLDGILSAIAETAMDAEGERVDGNGALINGSRLGAIGFISATVGGEDLTAGKGRLVIKYRLV